MYKNTIYREEYEVDLKQYELEQFKKKLQFDSIGDWLKYHRKIENLSQLQLSNRIGLNYNNLIKNIENGYSYPNREISIKLSEYFKLNTKYFYDPYLEESEQIHILLSEYRKKHYLKIKDAAKIIKVSPNAWSSWEKQKYEITRENYDKLKELKIL